MQLLARASKINGICDQLSATCDDISLHLPSLYPLWNCCSLCPRYSSCSKGFDEAEFLLALCSCSACFAVSSRRDLLTTRYCHALAVIPPFHKMSEDRKAQRRGKNSIPIMLQHTEKIYELSFENN